MKTTIHSYCFMTDKPEDAEAYAKLRAELIAQGLKCFETWGGNSHYRKELNGKVITLETEHLFNNQWNTAPIPGITDTGLRVFDWAQDYMLDGMNKRCKKGHWLTQTAEMKEARNNTAACGYCGKQEPAQKGYVFCPHCLDSVYLKSSELHLLRMVMVADGRERAPLTAAESAHLLPLYKEAQLRGNTKRGRVRIAKAREDIASEYARTVANAKEKRDAAAWIMDHMPGILENWIFYTHTKRHSFGWRNPVDAATLGELLEIISEFPYAYDIVTADGRTLSGG